MRFTTERRDRQHTLQLLRHDVRRLICAQSGDGKSASGPLAWRDQGQLALARASMLAG